MTCFASIKNKLKAKERGGGDEGRSRASVEKNITKGKRE